jgi:acyl-CoA synthetase (AMP-forming)/AMP-acid ligase II
MPARAIDATKMNDGCAGPPPHLSRLFSRRTALARRTYRDDRGVTRTRDAVKQILAPHFNTMTYVEADGRVRAIGAGLHHLLQSECGTLARRSAAAANGGGRCNGGNGEREDLRHVGLYAETKAEWILTALACFRYHMPIVTAYATLGLDALSYRWVAQL